jgi:hypothetical protein
MQSGTFRLQQRPVLDAMAGPADVDGLHRLLVDIRATVLDAPDEYPQCGKSYYAVFFADPDGLALEFVYRGSKECSRSIA